MEALLGEEPRDRDLLIEYGRPVQDGFGRKFKFCAARPSPAMQAAATAAE